MASEDKNHGSNEHAHLKALLEAAVDGVVLIDQRGLIENVSVSMEAMFGYTVAELVGENVRILMPEPDRSQHDQYLGNYLQTGKAKIIGIGREVTGRRKDGTLFDAELAVGQATRAGECFFVGFLRDLTARKEIEQRLRSQEERLAHVTRLSILGEMAAGIAHEINQPLTAISNYSEACGRLISNGAIEDEEVRDTLQQIGRQALRAGDVIHRLRRLARRGTSERDIINLLETVKDAIKLAETDARAFGMRITVEATGVAEGCVVADAVQIQQVMLNLLRNAMEAMHEIDNRSDPVRIRLHLAADALLEVQVIDHGTGVPAERLAELFEPFQTSKPSGMGIGLPISRSIIMAHGGQLRYEPAETGGAIFSFTLPQAVE